MLKCRRRQTVNYVKSLITALGLLLSGGALAHTNITYKADFSSQIFDSLADAETWLRANIVAGQFLEYDRPALLGARKIAYYYKYPELPIEDQQSRGFKINIGGQEYWCGTDSNGNSRYCESYAEAEERLRDFALSNTCDPASVSVQQISAPLLSQVYPIYSGIAPIPPGKQAARIAWRVPYEIRYLVGIPCATERVYTFNHDAWPWPYGNFTGIHQFDEGYCPDIFFVHTETAWNDGFPAYEAGKSCYRNETPKIVQFEFNQQESCPEGNPCYPLTGNKSHSVTDYAAPSLTFQRHYQSAMQVPGYALLGRGWTHNYAYFLSGASELTSDNDRLIVDDQGFYERFRYVGENRFRSTNKTGYILTRLSSSWQLSEPGGRRIDFDASGKPTAIIESRYGVARPTLLSYENGKLAAVTAPDGRQLLFHYQDRRLASITLPSGEKVQFSRAGNDNLSTVSYPGGASLHYHYEDARHPHHLTGITDENGDRYATYSYDARGRVTLSTHALNAERTELEYVTATQTRVTTPLGEVRTYTGSNDPFNKPGQISDSRGSRQWQYNTQRYPQVVTDRNNQQTHYSYSNFHQTQRIEAYGTPEQRTLETDYDEGLNRITETRYYDAANMLVKRTTLSYTPSGQLETRTEEDPASLETRSWSYSYYPSGVLQGLLQAVDGPRTDVVDVTSYAYYASDDPGGNYRTGDLWKTTNALGQVTEVLQYDAHGRALQIKDPNGVITQLEYTPRGWLKSRTEAFGTADAATTTFTYDNVGQLDIITQANGAWLDYDYDAAHRLTDISDNLGNTIHYTLDDAGNRTGEDTFDPQSALSRSLTRVYDSLGRLQDLIGNNGQQTRFTYDPNGNLKTRTEGYNTTQARTTTQNYDALDRLIEVIDPYNGAAKPTEYDYDSLDQLTQVTDPEGYITDYGLNALGDQHTLTSPDTGTTTALFDAAGNRTDQTDARGAAIGYEYDALGRIKLIDYTDNTLDISYSYDDTSNGSFGIGRLTGLSDASGTTSFVYDRRGRLIQQTHTVLGIPYQTDYAYDSAGNLEQITYPSGRTVDYALDTAGRISAVSTTHSGFTETLASAIQYDPFGPMTDFSYGNGLSRNVSFDLDGRMDGYAVSGSGGSVQDYGLDYTVTDTIRTIQDKRLVLPGNNFTLGYDTLDRLTSAYSSALDSTYTYTYDGVGNRLSQTEDPGGGPISFTDTYNYDPQNHRLLGVSGPNASSRGYDDAGNTTQLDGITLDYGDHNRLQSIQQNATTLASYTHNGQGQRVIKTANGQTTVFHYDPSGQLLAETDASGEVINEYIHLNGQPLALITASPATPTVTVYEDAEDGTTAGWEIYDPDPAGASIANVYDSVPEGQVIDVSGTGTQNGFRLRHADNTWWENSSATQAQWSHAISGNFQILFFITTDLGNGYVRYGPGTGTPYYVDGASVRYYHHYLGTDSNNGQWQTFTRDLVADITALDPGRTLLKVRAFLIRGSGRVDDITLIAPPTAGLQFTTHYLHPDHLGTVRAITDQTQTVVWRWDSAPFGETLPNEDPDGDGQAFSFNLRFPGQYFDPETGLHYNYFRDYDPSVGRYVQSDPIGLDGGINTYAYAESNPTVKIDPYGLRVPARPPPGSGQLMGVFGQFCDLQAWRQYQKTEADKERVKRSLKDCQKVYWSRCARLLVWFNNTKCVTNVTIKFSSHPINNVYPSGGASNSIVCEYGVLIGEQNMCCKP